MQFICFTLAPFTLHLPHLTFFNYIIPYLNLYVKSYFINLGIIFFLPYYIYLDLVQNVPLSLRQTEQEKFELPLGLIAYLFFKFALNQSWKNDVYFFTDFSIFFVIFLLFFLFFLIFLIIFFHFFTVFFRHLFDKKTFLMPL